jgi:hypothetical protein
LRALTAHLLEVLTLLALLVQKYKILTQTLRKKEIRHAACAAWCTSVSRGRACSYKSTLLVQILTQKLEPKKKKYDTPPVLHGALAYRGDVTAATVPEAAHRVAYAFLSALTAAGNFFFLHAAR